VDTANSVSNLQANRERHTSQAPCV
jgi:hypothetical protein